MYWGFRVDETGIFLYYELISGGMGQYAPFCRIKLCFIMTGTREFGNITFDCSGLVC